MTNTQIETYIPLYRKYRPQTFADVVGQEAIVQTLSNAITLSKVAHAYLFCGPRGTGKTSMARIFAKSLNCENGPTPTPCLQCASCVGITNGNALDVVEFDAASNNGVQDARELIENCQYSSMSGRFKVYIIDEVHMLTSQAFNALLKTLEEPPPNVIFIFATTEAHKVLPTIISRCQRFDFNRIVTDNIASRLRYIATAEEILIDDEALATIARHVRGGMRDAVGLLDQVGVLSRANPGQTISRQDVSMFIGTLEEDLLLRLGATIAERKAADLLTTLEELMCKGVEPIQLLKELTFHFRNLLLVQASGVAATASALGLPQAYFEQLQAQTALFPAPEELPQIIGRFSSIERNIRNGTHPQLWLEVGLLELTYRHEIHRIQDLSDRLERLETQLAGGAMPASASSKPMASRPAPTFSANPQPSAPAPPVFHAPPAPVAAPVQIVPPKAQSVAPAPAPVTGSPSPTRAAASLPAAPTPVTTASGGGVPSELDTIYRDICANVPSLTLRSLLQQQAFPLSMVNDVLTVGVSSEPNLAVLKKPDRSIHLQRAAEKYYDRPVQVELVFEKNRPAAAPQARLVSPAPAPAARAVAQPPAPPALQTSAPNPVLNDSVATAPSVAPPPTKPDFPTLIEASVPMTSVETPEAPVKRPAMAAMPEAAPLLNLKGAPPMKMPASSSGSSTPSFGDAPPMDDDAPPMDDDGPMGNPMDDDDAFDEPGLPASTTFDLSVESTLDPELKEAKKHTIELLQGKVID